MEASTLAKRYSNSALIAFRNIYIGACEKVIKTVEKNQLRNVTRIKKLRNAVFGNAWRKIASMPKKFAQVTRSETNERRGTHAQKFTRNMTVRRVSKLYFEKISV